LVHTKFEEKFSFDDGPLRAATRRIGRHTTGQSQPPAPFHAIARGFAGPSLLAMMLVEKYANHQPLNRRKNEQTINLPGPGTPNARGTSSEVAGRPTNSGKPFSPSPHESDHRG